jgi:hypothetical protein
MVVENIARKHRNSVGENVVEDNDFEAESIYFN